MIKSGIKFSKETKRRMSESAKKRNLYGERNPFFGKHHSEETKEIIRLKRVGKKASEITRRKMSELHKGNKVNLGRHPSIETRRKMSEGKKGNKNSLGYHHTNETCQKMSAARKGKPKSKEHCRSMGVVRKGEKNPMWRGGLSFEPYCIKFNDEFRERVRVFFNYQCIECGTPQHGRKLGVHHINFDKQSCCNNTLPLFVTLCLACHLKTNFNREFWERHFTNVINEYYGGKCYFTKEEMEAYTLKETPKLI
jgi:hypothetical protein